MDHSGFFPKILKNRFKNLLKIFILLILITNNLWSNESQAVSNLAKRVIGQQKSANFIFEKTEFLDNKETFKISSKDNKILIQGDTPVAMASGLNWYLKYFCNAHISWEGKQLDLPDALPKVDPPITKKSTFEYSYYLNYCTFNYTMSFWDWERWEKEIDWMALNGINLPLTVVGSQAIWQNTLRKIGLSEGEIDKFIPGPAFTAWWLMGNLEGWGGPVSDSYIDQQTNLHQKILHRMRELGIEPVVPGFYGMVPNSLKRKYPEADIRDQGNWVGGFQRPALLSPTDTLFSKIANIYYNQQKKLYGDLHYFSGDPFHEGGKTKEINLSRAGKKIVHSMNPIFRNTTWLFQGWGGNPKAELIKNIASDNVLILDLDCDNRPQWRRRKGWSKPWIWSTINNFGGNVGLFGRMDVIATEPFNALNHPEYGDNLKGIGAIMEGIENNSVIYELLLELKWRNSPPDLDIWIERYVTRRYGQHNQDLINAYQILRNTVFGQKLREDKSQQGTTESILCARPALEIDHVSTWGTSKLYYDPAKLLKAWRIYIKESQSIDGRETFNYDLVNITRQILANYSQVLHKKAVKAYNNRNKTNFDKYSTAFVELINNQDSLLNSVDEFMLGPWIASARSRATNDREKDLFEFNARTLITTWSYKNSNLHDYAHRELAGLLKDFYKPRWKMFFEYLKAKLEGKAPDKPDFYKFEENWTKQSNDFPARPIYNPVKMSKNMYKKYYNKINNSYK